jgi:hypothetical protein
MTLSRSTVGVKWKVRKPLIFTAQVGEVWFQDKVSILSLERSLFPFREWIRDFHEFLQNFGILLQYCIVSQASRPQYEHSLPWKFENLYLYCL